MIINRDNFYLPNKLGAPKKEREIDLKKNISSNFGNG